MISFLLVAGIAYGIAYLISSTGLAYWRAFVGFMLGLITAWLGGSFLASMLLFPSGGDGNAVLQLMAKGMWWAILGAGFGVYRARFKLKTGNTAPAFVFPKWVLKVVGGMAVIGIAAAVGIPAYQDYAKGQAIPIAFGENDKIVNEPAVSPSSSINPQSFGENDAAISPPVKGQSGMFNDLIPRNAVRNTTSNLTTSKRDKYEEFLDSPSSAVKVPNSFTYEEATGQSTQPNQSATTDAIAQIERGVMYYEGKGVAQDYLEALRWFRLAAAQGHVIAQFNLGTMYYMGKGVAQDYVEAVRWYRLAVAQGNAMAQFNLGVSYANGQGVSKDFVEAAKWYRLAAAQGHAESQWSLAWLYTNGQGVVRDDAEASKWFRLAAQQGHAGGQVGLGMAYADGRGLHRDQVKALMWQNLAALSGNPFMVEGRDRLAQSMTPQQVAQAQKMTRDCQQRKFKGCG